ncbi:MAG TPA: glycosyltransferase family 4 protein [Solirubrobacteraceae bacterium]
MTTAHHNTGRPVLFVTGHAPAHRVGALARLNDREGIELALFGGRSKHGGEVFEGEMPVPHRSVRPRELARLAASGAYRAVVCPTGGRVAPLATWAGARRARVPLILWASLWAHPRSGAHLLSYLPLRRLYRSADAVVTYGPHVSAYVLARGARNVHVAPQSVDNAFWGAPDIAPVQPGWPARASVRFLFVGRDAPEKGIGVLVRAWLAAGLRPPAAALALAGVDPDGRGTAAARPSGESGIVALGRLSARALRDAYAASDALVLPSLRTRTFREPWGLVVNEAMNRSLPVIASDEVGAVAGGLVRDGVNGLVVPAGDDRALAQALKRLAEDPELRARLGQQGASDVAAYSDEAWADGFSQALSSLGLSRGRW